MSIGASSSAGGATPVWLQAGRPGASRRDPRYELFILGELMGSALHGYLLHEILNRLLGPFRQMSWGALYPLIHGLERDGLIEADAGAIAKPDGTKPGGTNSDWLKQEGAGNRQRHSYRLTEAGRARFQTLMREPSAYTAGYPELFLIKLNLLGYVTAEERLVILRHHRRYLQISVDYLINEQQYVAQRPGLPEHERPQILRLLGYRLSGVQAELAWIDAELARL